MPYQSTAKYEKRGLHSEQRGIQGAWNQLRNVPRPVRSARRGNERAGLQSERSPRPTGEFSEDRQREVRFYLRTMPHAVGDSHSRARWGIELCSFSTVLWQPFAPTIWGVLAERLLQGRTVSANDVYGRSSGAFAMFQDRRRELRDLPRSA